MKTDAATLKRVYAMSLAGVYPHYVAKAEKKGRTKAEVDEIIRWLTGYTQKQLESILEKRTNIETFISKARMNPSRTLVTGAICGVRVEEIEDPVMQGIRYLDKLIDELAKGQADGEDPAEGLNLLPSTTSQRPRWGFFLWLPAPPPGTPVLRHVFSGFGGFWRV